jgi:hypothetical protein
MIGYNESELYFSISVIGLGLSFVFTNPYSIYFVQKALYGTPRI